MAPAMPSESPEKLKSMTPRLATWRRLKHRVESIGNTDIRTQHSLEAAFAPYVGKILTPNIHRQPNSPASALGVVPLPAEINGAHSGQIRRRQGPW